MSSPDPARPPAEPPDRLPPALSSMWRLCRLGFRYEPALMGVSFGLSLAASLPDALLAVWFTLLGEGLIMHKPACTATAEPPEEPPGTLVSSNALRVGPKAEFSLEEPIANSSKVVLPITTAPAVSSRSMTVAS